MSDRTEARRSVVTGANSGVGYETALGLARLGDHVVMVCRDPARGAAARDRIAAQTDADVDLLVADLAEMASVRALAEEIRTRYSRLDVLINNAGLIRSKREVTGEGLERTFATNHLAPFLLTGLLRDLLVSSSPARVITVSSDVHRSGRLDLSDLQSQRRYSAFRVYSTTKLHNVLFTRELARRLEGTGVTANACHPGFVASNFAHGNRGVLGIVFPLLQRAAAISPQQGAVTSLHLAVSDEVDGETGGYWVKCRRVEPSAAARDADAARRLWEASERLVVGHGPPRGPTADHPDPSTQEDAG